MKRIMKLAVLACAVSSTVTPSAHVDFDHTFHFSQYKTYRWVRLPDTELAGPQLTQAQFPNQLMQERVVGFVEEALAARRLTRVETGGDLLIGCQLNVTEQTQLTTITDGWGWGSAISTTTPQTILIGTLVVNIMDPRRNQLVFQGMYRETISSRPQRNIKKLAKAVNEIFEKYPPQL
jgi:hypothetical protein